MRNDGRREVNTFTIAADSSGIYCYCSVTNVAIQRTAKSPNFFSYQGTVEGSCTGSYYCQGVSSIEYLWTVVSGGAFIDGPNNGPTVNVTTNGPAKFEIELKGTIVCSDGTRCTSASTFKDSFGYEPKNCNCSVDVDCQKVQTQGTLRTFTGGLMEDAPASTELPLHTHLAH